MASSEKRSSVFTSNSTGGKPGDSDGLKRTSMPSGGSMLSAYPQDNQSGLPLPNTRGGKMGGSESNLSHSLSGASAVTRQK